MQLEVSFEVEHNEFAFNQMHTIVWGTHPDSDYDPNMPTHGDKGLLFTTSSDQANTDTKIRQAYIVEWDSDQEKFVFAPECNELS